MNIVIISGGSGNDSLLKGLVELYPEGNINVITNAYDSGKSTGICRKVTNTLGVSDIRKNHVRLYKILNKNPDKRLLEFYEKRFDFTKGYEVDEILDLLRLWDLTEFSKYVCNFFNRETSKLFTYTDFSVANIVYSEMYSTLGYEKTNKYFCDKLGIPDFVTLNSFDNIYINGLTEEGYIIEDEGDLVNWRDPDNKIIGINYDTKFHEGSININHKAIDLVKNANLIIISTGTFWSSIYPTLDYGCFYNVINKSKAKKIWVMNNEEDKDSYGVTSKDFANILSKKVKDLIILENLDAVEGLRSNPDAQAFHMGNNSGKHDPIKLATQIFRLYYKINDISYYNQVFFDFDDTLWSRDNSKEEISKENIKLLSDLNFDNDIISKLSIVSGNTFKSIRQKISKVLGTNFKSEFHNINIWADANSSLFIDGKFSGSLQSMIIPSEVVNIVSSILGKFNLNDKCELIGEDGLVNIKIKPLGELERALLADLLNKYLDIFGCKAELTGTTTVDIVTKTNNKSEIYKTHKNLDSKKSLYIGDELDSGNDRDIALMCSKAILVSDVSETRLILKLLF